ncbi:TetR/AcrR family transcriptional regulator [Slackia heliotrinireducens]|uniref:Transcriptional regulator n=1 Tax=Slackia heliotrinireducens (strain ATCC 29202 / DSM 20476 / NCTC 11029 / RHS 1) TaxID=471855 RepID=C7N4E6_SLAHD|nr:TetR/AcrR family transcriptional regulator [Slackia heliotrinireducens]ACV21781.1 transcriptional regulator [Slackia heliotrinireducens DSM 20476]VEG99459.1 DNA-binding transcriptional repressor FabR [Slackia heliotrinireducens]
MAADAVCVEDRRIVKTRAALREALIELTEERGWNGFSINDLCERANINRGTFYNHYRDKDELMMAFQDEVLEQIGNLQTSLADMSLEEVAMCVGFKKPLPIMVTLFDYLRKEGRFLHAVLGPNGDAAFGLRLCTYVCNDIVKAMLNEQYRTGDDAFVDYYVTFYASAYFGVIRRWIEQGMVESSEEMAVICQRLLFIMPGEPIKL